MKVCDVFFRLLILKFNKRMICIFIKLEVCMKSVYICWVYNCLIY